MNENTKGAGAAPAVRPQSFAEIMPKREAFIKHCEERGLDTSIQKDEWGAHIFAHSHIQAMWEVWFSATAPASPTPIVVEDVTAAGTQWGVSFAGANPEAKDYVACASMAEADGLIAAPAVDAAKPSHRLTIGEAAKAVGAWEDSSGNVCFGTWMAVRAFAMKMQRDLALAHVATHPACASPVDAAELGELKALAEAVPVSQRRVLYEAALDCHHKITEQTISLFRNPTLEGNALSQLADRLDAVAAPLAALVAQQAARIAELEDALTVSNDAIAHLRSASQEGK